MCGSYSRTRINFVAAVSMRMHCDCPFKQLRHARLAVGWPLVWLKATNCHMTTHAWERNACEMALSHSVLKAQACMFRTCTEPKQNAMQPIFDGSVDLHCLAEPWLGRARQVKTAMFWTSLTPHTSRAHTGRLDVISKPHVANMWWPKATLLSLTCFWEQSFVFAADSRGLAAILHLQTSTQNERQRVILWVWKVSDSGPKKNLTSDTCERNRCHQKLVLHI